ncbi:protein involved in ribonucleotide reduction [Melghirimyces algeriensis]|uniref:Protein NrdI n=1 Tax=Melghirimyces algeriensis TaxID=910412 RepID=A0A521F7K5_9BACL|nr:protein involved in ribonucleotide reduction [Melghirimyces algeriensis]
MILVVYTSRTGNVRRFVQRLGMPSVEIRGGVWVNSPFLLITPTIGFGQVPGIVDGFLTRNKRFLVGVASSGNKNWGSNFAKAGELVAKKYEVPLLHKFELSGTRADVEILLKRVGPLETHRVK